MKIPTPLLTLLAACTLGANFAFADYTVPLAEPPFKFGETIIGIEGWEHRLVADKENNDSARLEKLYWEDELPVFVFDGASVKNDFPKTTGSQVRITLRVAFTFPEKPLALQQFRLLIGGAPFREIVFQGNEEGGIGFGAGDARTMKVLVPFHELKSQSFYTITILMDYDRASYDISITGTKADESPLTFEQKDIAIEGAPHALQNMAIITAKSIHSYVSQLTIESL